MLYGMNKSANAFKIAAGSRLYYIMKDLLRICANLGGNLQGLIEIKMAYNREMSS